MKFRLATIEDLELLFTWRNDPVTRMSSINSQEVLLEEHTEWLQNSLNNLNREIYIFEDKNIPVGTIRIDTRKDNIYVLSWTISPEFRGRGYGTEMLDKFLDGKSGKFLAEILEENISSIRMVEKNGFRLLSSDIPDMPLLYYKVLGKRTDA